MAAYSRRFEVGPNCTKAACQMCNGEDSLVNTRGCLTPSLWPQCLTNLVRAFLLLAVMPTLTDQKFSKSYAFVKVSRKAVVKVRQEPGTILQPLDYWPTALEIQLP